MFFLKCSDNRVVEGVCVWLTGVIFTWYLTLQNGVFIWYLCDGGYTWDRARACVWINPYSSKYSWRKSVFNQKYHEYCHIPLSTPPPFQDGLYDVCVYETNTKRMTEEKRERTRESEGALFRQRERGWERQKKRERQCVGLHIIMTHVNVRVNIFATARSYLMIYCAQAIKFCVDLVSK